MAEATRKPGEYPQDPRLLDPKKFNILLPSLNMGDNLPPGVKLRLLYLSTDARLIDDGEAAVGHDIYKSGRGNMLDPNGRMRWVYLYSLGARFLDRLRLAMGVSMDTGRVDDRSDPNRREMKAIITYNLPDGRLAQIPGSAEYDIQAVTEDFENKLMKEMDAGNGAITRKRWNAQANRTDEIRISGEDALRVIESEVRDHNNFVRRYAVRNAETRAKSAALRSLIGLNDSLAPWEVILPFVVYAYEFPVQVNGPQILTSLYPAKLGQAAPPEPVSGTETEVQTPPKALPQAARAASSPPAASQPPRTADRPAQGPARTAASAGAKPAPAPSLADRIAIVLKRDETITLTEIRDVVRDLALNRGMEAPKALATMAKEEMLGYIQALKDLPARS